MPNVGCVNFVLYALRADQTSQQNKRNVVSNTTLPAAPFPRGSNDTTILGSNVTVTNYTLGGDLAGKFSAVTGQFASDVYQVPDFGTHAYGAGNSSVAPGFGTDAFGSSNTSVPNID